MVEKALSRIESNLLPSIETSIPGKNITNIPSFESSPTSRLDQLLFQVTVGDHIRTMQTMYRDINDEQQLELEIRMDKSDTKMPMKDLLLKITEGRSRAVALCRMCYGENTMEEVKAILDLASSYALQGMWPQVEAKVEILIHKLDSLANKKSLIGEHNKKRIIAYEASERIDCVYQTLRNHVIQNFGLVNKSFIRELILQLSNVKGSSEINNEVDDDQINFLFDVTKLASSLHGFFVKRKSKQAIDRSYEINTPEKRSWGELVDFLRTNCSEMMKWVTYLESYLLPQSKACLMLPFKICDQQSRGIAHPMQLAQLLTRFPATARVLSGIKLTKALNSSRAEVPLSVNVRTGSLKDLQTSLSIYGTNINEDQQSILYELPITWEEFLSKYTLESISSNINQLNIIKAQIYTLQGVSRVYTEKISSAEEPLLKALSLLEKMGLENEVISCDLYNSIAQMMIIKHRVWQSNKKARLTEDTNQWIQTEETKSEIKRQVKIIKKQYDYKSIAISSGEIELKAKNNVFKSKLSQLTHEDNTANPHDFEPINKSLEAAYRYLVRSFENLEEAHGQYHPSVATSCLAIASVKNIIEDYEDTREWLVRALRNMEKLYPIPLRAISFTQTQLSNVLFKLGHDDQAIQMLARASSFHMSLAMQGIVSYNNQTDKADDLSKIIIINNNQYPETDVIKDNNRMGLFSIQPPIMKNSPLYEEIKNAIDLTNRVMKMISKGGNKFQASLQSEEIAKLTETAFGWDSIEAAEAFKQTGVRSAAALDWSRASRYLKLSLESHEVLFGKNDPKTIEVVKLIHSVKKKRSEVNKMNIVNEDDHSERNNNKSPPTIITHNNDNIIPNENDGSHTAKSNNTIIGNGNQFVAGISENIDLNYINYGTPTNPYTINEKMDNKSENKNDTQNDDDIIDPRWIQMAKENNNHRSPKSSGSYSVSFPNSPESPSSKNGYIAPRDRKRVSLMAFSNEGNGNEALDASIKHFLISVTLESYKNISELYSEIKALDAQQFSQTHSHLNNLQQKQLEEQQYFYLSWTIFGVTCRSRDFKLNPANPPIVGDNIRFQCMSDPNDPSLENILPLQLIEAFPLQIMLYSKSFGILATASVNPFINQQHLESKTNNNNNTRVASPV
eukprot:gene14417-19348_t